jgi:transposase-like protein
LAARRVTMREAADILGVSKEAVRKRVVRGTLRSDTGEDGRRYVYLDLDADEAPTGESSALISELRAHNATLREQLEAERQAHAEARRIIAGLVERVPAIEASPEAPESPTGPAEGPTPTESAGVPQEGTERPSWWRRMFGGG